MMESGMQRPINLLHFYSPWTWYYQSLLDGFRFKMLASRKANDDFGPIPVYDKANPDHQQVLVGGTPFENFNDEARVLIRYQHSPGFGLTAFLKGYSECIGLFDQYRRRVGMDRANRTGRRKYMLPDTAFDCMVKTEALTKPMKRLRDQLLRDPNVLVTPYDPALNELYRTPRLVTRVPGTALIACNWKMSRSKSDIDRVVQVMKYLVSQGLKVKVQLHLLALNWPGGATNYRYLLDRLEELERTGMLSSFSKVVGRPELIKLFDESEFIVSEGSGSLYEAVARGCKALTISGITYQTKGRLFHAALDGGYLAPIDAMNLKNHHKFEKDFD
jgi:hypothetical protein